MTELMQALRDMSRDGFELFVHHFLRARYTAANVTKIAGDGGDQGIDSFSGTLGKGPAIWQAKHFVNGIGRAQRQQILSSLKTALAARALSYWTLCVPVDLNVEQRSWFQEKVEAAYGNQVKISLLQGSELIEEVSRNSELRDAFFPNNVITNALRARDIFLKTDGATIPELHDILAMQRDVLVERYAKLDTRFVPRVTIGPGSQVPPTRTGVVFSKISEHFRVDFVPRDPTAYLDDPVHTRFSISPEFSRRFEEALDKGFPVTLPIMNFTASTPLLAELEDLAGGIQLSVASKIPPHLAGRQLLVKLVTGEEPSPISLPFFDLRVIRFGRMEFELKSTSDSPIGLSVLINNRKIDSDPRASIQLRMQLVGADVRAASKVIRFLDTFQRSGKFQLVAIENDKPIMSQATGYESPCSVPEDVGTLIHRVAQIADYFGKDIPVPPGISNEDLESARTLYSIATGEPFQTTEWSIDVVKEGDSQIDRVGLLNGTGPFSLRVQQPIAWKTLTLFGTKVDTGPVIIELTECSLKSPNELNSYDRTAIGDPFRLEFVVNGPCRFLPPSSMNDPEDPLLGTGGRNGRLDMFRGNQTGSAE